MPTKGPLGSSNALIYSVKAADSGTSILAKVSGGETSIFVPRSEGKFVRGSAPDMRDDSRRPAAHRSLMRPSWRVSVSTASACRLLLPFSANTAGGSVTPVDQVVCVQVVASSRPMKLRLHGSNPLGNSTAARQRKAPMLPPRGAQASIRDTERSDEQPTFPPSAAPRELPIGATFLEENLNSTATYPDKCLDPHLPA